MHGREFPDHPRGSTYGDPPQRAPLPTYPDGTVDVSRVKDDKGKPATGNLWVGGFRDIPTDLEVSERSSLRC